MLPSEKRSLNTQLISLAAEIDEQMITVNDEAQGMGIDPAQMKYADGTYVLPPLLLAQAQVLNARVHLLKE